MAKRSGLSRKLPETRIDAETAAALKARAELEDRSQGSIVRRALRLYLRDELPTDEEAA